MDVPELDGVWATGRTVEDARRNFIGALEDWIAAHLTWGIAIPPIGRQTINVSKEPISVVQACLCIAICTIFPAPIPMLSQ